MKTSAQASGAKGEELAAEHYVADGYHVLVRNYRTRLGEVDLILEKDGLLVFAEVKARGAGSIAAPREWVGPAKQRRVMAAAQQFLQEKDLGEPMLRFDVVELQYAADGSHRLTRLEDAFEL